MKYVDLSQDAARRAIVDKEEGQYLGHPTTALLRDGRTILCVYPKGHGKGEIVYKRSADGGRTWSERLPVPDSFKTSLECPTLYRVSDRRLLLFSGMYPGRVASSDDEGATWTELRPVGDYGGIVFVSSLYRRRDGALLALFHDDGGMLRKTPGEKRFTVYGITSRDEGETWSEPVALVSRGDADLCEPCLIPSPDGEKLAMLLRENSRAHLSFLCESDDDGATWKDLREMPACRTGDRHAAKYLRDGRLFVSFRDMAPDSATKGDWVGWIGSFEDILRGREGDARVLLGKNRHAWDCAYPGVEVLADGTVVATTYGHWGEGEPPYVVSVRFSPDEAVFSRT